MNNNNIGNNQNPKFAFWKYGHPLTYTTESAGYHGGDFLCDNWRQSFFWNIGRWSCLNCRFDICQAC